MRTFITLSELERTGFAVWAFVLCFAGVSGTIHAATRRRYAFIPLMIALFAPSYLFMQVICELRNYYRGREVNEVAMSLGRTDYILWIGAFTAITVAMAVVFVNLRHGGRRITPATIKICADRMPCGMCYWRDSGRVIFVNRCMNHLCEAITKKPLVNGQDFSNSIKTSIITIEGKVWQFTRRELSFDGGNLHEMIASDITEAYAKTEALARDNRELMRLNHELEEYNLRIDDTVRRQEILEAKVNIHDEMNKLMLSTVATDVADAESMNRIFELWERNALLLCMEADKKNEPNSEVRLDKLASALGIELIWENPIPESLSEKQKELFYITAQESMANAVKHANARQMKISIEEDDKTVKCRFANNGDIPDDEMHFSGGLANLARVAAEQNATVAVETDDEFTITLCFAK